MMRLKRLGTEQSRGLAVMIVVSVWAAACGTPTSPSGTVTLTISPVSVVAGETAQGTIMVKGTPPSANEVITLTSSNSAATVPPSVTLAAGATQVTFAIATSVVSAVTTITITASPSNTSAQSNVSAQATLSINPSTLTLSSLTLNPSEVPGGASTQAIVQLSGAAPSGGATIALSSSDTSGVVTLPSSIVLTAGTSSATLTVATRAATARSQVTLSATYAGSTKTAVLTIGVSTETSVAICGPWNGPVPIPFHVYADNGDGRLHYIPSGFFGDIADLRLSLTDTSNPHSGATAIRIDYSPKGAQGFAGIFWQCPENNFGTVPGAGFNLTQARQLQFWARSSVAGKGEFKVGGIGHVDPRAPFPDSLDSTPTTPTVVDLGTDWRLFTIDLSRRDLSAVIGGFMFVASITENRNGITVFIDDIVFQ